MLVSRKAGVMIRTGFFCGRTPIYPRGTNMGPQVGNLQWVGQLWDH
jgi:hypothetical protein